MAKELYFRSYQPKKLHRGWRIPPSAISTIIVLRSHNHSNATRTANNSTVEIDGSFQVYIQTLQSNRPLETGLDYRLLFSYYITCYVNKGSSHKPRNDISETKFIYESYVSVNSKYDHPPSKTPGIFLWENSPHPG